MNKTCNKVYGRITFPSTNMILWIFPTIFFLISSPSQGNPTDYGKNSATKMKMCEINSKEFGEDMDRCGAMETQAMRDLLGGCKKEVLETMVSGTYEYLKIACSDKSVFRKADACLEKKKEELQTTEFGKEAEECFAEVTKKYGLPDA